MRLQRTQGVNHFILAGKVCTAAVSVKLSVARVGEDNKTAENGKDNLKHDHRDKMNDRREVFFDEAACNPCRDSGKEYDERIDDSRVQLSS